MSDTEKAEAATEESVDAEPGGMSERTAKVVLLAVALLAIWGIVTVLPEVAYVVVGVLGCLAWQRVRAWFQERRNGDGQEEAEQEEPPDVVEALQSFGRSVLLTELQKKLSAADTKTVRKLLKTAGVRVRSGVRTSAGNGPGVHKDDIPAPSPDESGAHGDGCCCRSANNTNANNAQEEPSQKGLRVEAIGLAGAVVHDPSEAVRRHRVQ